MADGLLEAVRGLRLAHPELGPKPLLAKLREQQPGLAAGNKEVREALLALKAESEATEAAAAAPPIARPIAALRRLLRARATRLPPRGRSTGIKYSNSYQLATGLDKNETIIVSAISLSRRVWRKEVIVKLQHPTSNNWKRNSMGASRRGLAL